MNNNKEFQNMFSVNKDNFSIKTTQVFFFKSSNINNSTLPHIGKKIVWNEAGATTFTKLIINIYEMKFV